jgi:transposase
MSAIPTSVTEEQFNDHIRPYLNTAKRGYECSIPLYKVFNYILYRLHTGCQWDQLPIDKVPGDPEKKKSAMTRFTTIFASGAGMVAWKKCGKPAFWLSRRRWIFLNSIWMAATLLPRKVVNR